VLTFDIGNRPQTFLMAIGEELGQIPPVGVDRVWREVALVTRPTEEIVDRRRSPFGQFG
jgi:hypothetical protein